MKKLKIIDPVQDKLESDLVFYKRLSFGLGLFLVLAVWS